MSYITGICSALWFVGAAIWFAAAMNWRKVGDRAAAVLCFVVTALFVAVGVMYAIATLK